MFLFSRMFRLAQFVLRVKRPGCETDHSPTSSTKINAWSYTSAPPCAFMACRGTSPLPQRTRLCYEYDLLYNIFVIGGVPSSIMMLSYAGQMGSSELEFFRHRIHLERDSVRRAKNFLRSQRTSFQSRQRELKQQQLDGSKTARSMLDQLYQVTKESVTELSSSTY